MKRTQVLSIIITMSAMGVAGGWLFSFIPNVEVITSIVFLTGYITGLYGGMSTGIIIYLIFGFFNPYGPSPLPFLIIQCLAGSIAGIGGFLQRRFFPENIILFMLNGFTITLLYDIITNLGGFILFPTGKTFAFYLIAGLPFALIHILSNTVIFGFVLLPLTKKLKRRFL